MSGRGNKKVHGTRVLGYCTLRCFTCPHNGLTLSPWLENIEILVKIKGMGGW